MKISEVLEKSALLSDSVKQSESGPVVVKRRGRAVAVVLTVHGQEDLESLLLARSPELKQILVNSQKQARQGHTVSHTEFWAGVAASKPSTAPRPRRTKAKD
ncbi:MAG: type II toxin-antitoxin system Phd/YefM family antitoxin [Candidatus Saccharimonas sp.]|nr:type II toxin-antitoxin system Phd/YefM family antitoxin [Planctomycetaceae bacterium]